jgi:type VI secretion system protein ImpA
MATVTDFDLEALLAPIPGDCPTGVDLRDDSYANLFYEVKDHRVAAGKLEKILLEQTWDPNGTPPDPYSTWIKLQDSAVELIGNSSKDLEVVAYLIEALVRVEGFAGMLAGFQLANGLIDRYWVDLFPRSEEQDPGTTILHLAQLNGLGGEGTLPPAIRNVMVTNERAGESYTFLQYLDANRMKTLPTESQERLVDEGKIPLDKIERSAKATPLDYYRGQLSDIEAINQELKRLDELLKVRLPEKAQPSFNRVREQLEDVVRAIKVLAPGAFTQPEQPGEGNGTAADGSPTGDGAGGTHAGPVASRAAAFRQLADIADFFERTEPLSLLAEQIRKVVRLGQMNPLEYFSELIDDDSIRSQMFKLVGIKRASDDE